MSYASEILGERTVFDADAHIIEEPTWLHDHADAKTRKMLPPPIRGIESDPETDLIEQIMPGSDFQAVQSMGDAERIRRAEQNVMEAKNYRALGSFRSEERPRALDLIGVQKQVVFATESIAYFDTHNVGVPVDTPRDPQLLYAGSHAHNRGMAEFCKSDDRLIATGYVPLEDPEQSAQTVDQALEVGCGAFYVPHAVPEQRSWSHPDYDVVWERIAESGRPMLLHVGAGDKSLRFPEAVYNNGRPTTYLLGEHTWQLPDLMTWHWPAELMLTQLILDGVFDRFPKLRCGVIELRASWVPSFISRLDWCQFAMYTNPTYAEEYRLPRAASDYVRRQIKFTPWAQGGDPLASMIETVDGGERLFLFSTDYPHDEGGTDPIGGFEAEFEKLAQRPDLPQIRDLFYRENFAELLGI